LTFTVENVTPLKTNFVQVNADFVATNWVTVATNVSSTDNFIFADREVTNSSRRFYRVKQVPR